MVDVRRIQLVNRLAAKNLGNPGVPAAWDETDKRTHWLGIIVGRATGLSFRTDKDDETVVRVALTGTFKGIPADDKLPFFVSTTCYLPSVVHGHVVEMVRKSVAHDPETGEVIDISEKDKPRKGKRFEMQGNVIEIALRIGTHRIAGTGVMYEYVVEQLSEMASVNPLADLEARLGLSGPVPASQLAAVQEATQAVAVKPGSAPKTGRAGKK